MALPCIPAVGLPLSLRLAGSTPLHSLKSVRSLCKIGGERPAVDDKRRVDK